MVCIIGMRNVPKERMEAKSNVMGCHVQVHAANVSYVGHWCLEMRISGVLGQAVEFSRMCVIMEIRVKDELVH